MMNDTDFNTRSSEFLGDMSAWLQENAEDNSDQISRLKRNLRKARAQELTSRQRQIVDRYYEGGMSIQEIAGELGLDRSTVSRTLRRAKERLYHVLQYSL